MPLRFFAAESGRSYAVAAGIGMIAAPVSAHAHLVSTRFGDFYGGLLHLLLTLEHLLPMLALGLLAGLQGSKAGRSTLAAAPLGLLCGVLLARMAPGLSPLEWINQGSFVILGLLLATAWRLPRPVLSGLAWLFGVSHGYGNGLAMSAETNLVLFSVGIVTGGFLLLALVAAAVVSLNAKAHWVSIAVRALGSWIAAVGVMVAIVR